ncbi:MAG: ABC-2 transporter permease [Anaerolineaceae bacterium]
MKGLILKDIFNLKVQGHFYLFFILIFTVVSFISEDVNTLGGVIALICAMVPITALGLDEKNNWDKYALTLPVVRKDLVLSKYYLGILCAVIGSVVSFILTGLFSDFSLTTLYTTLIFFVISLFYLSLMLPLMFKFGVEKGRISMLMVAFLPALAISFLANRFPGMFSTGQQASMLQFLPIAVTGLILISLFVSITISIRIYNKKEF